MIHELPLAEATIHGYFSSVLPPVLSVEPGDSVRFQSLNAGWSWDLDLEFVERDEELHSGHALNGPVEVRGAAPKSGPATDARHQALVGNDRQLRGLVERDGNSVAGRGKRIAQTAAMAGFETTVREVSQEFVRADHGVHAQRGDAVFEDGKEVDRRHRKRDPFES